jgi:hypothetical protein
MFTREQPLTPAETSVVGRTASGPLCLGMTLDTARITRILPELGRRDPGAPVGSLSPPSLGRHAPLEIPRKGVPSLSRGRGALHRSVVRPGPVSIRRG